MEKGLLLWIISGFFVLNEFSYLAQDQYLSRPRKILAGVILIIFSPAFLLQYCATSLLDLILPEGWNDDENFRY